MISVMIADDQAVVREGLRRILARAQDVTVVDDVATGQEVLDALGERAVDVLLLDITLPGMSGIDVLQELRSRRADVAVLVVSMLPEDDFAARVLELGGAGYVCKATAPRRLVAAVRAVARGGRYFAPA